MIHGEVAHSDETLSDDGPKIYYYWTFNIHMMLSFYLLKKILNISIIFIILFLLPLY